MGTAPYPVFDKGVFLQFQIWLDGFYCLGGEAGSSRHVHYLTQKIQTVHTIIRADL
jgi:hypothetical protein